MDITDFENEQLVETQNIALRVQIAAAAIASSFLLILVPNVETISLTAFFVGFLFPASFAISIVLTMVFGWEIFASIVFSFSGPTFFFKLVGWILIMLLGVFAQWKGTKALISIAVIGFLGFLISCMTIYRFEKKK